MNGGTIGHVHLNMVPVIWSAFAVELTCFLYISSDYLVLISASEYLHYRLRIYVPVLNLTWERGTNSKHWELVLIGNILSQVLNNIVSKYGPENLLSYRWASGVESSLKCIRFASWFSKYIFKLLSISILEEQKLRYQKFGITAGLLNWRTELNFALCTTLSYVVLLHQWN